MTLLGPPELYKLTQDQPKPRATDPFIDLMLNNFNNTVAVANRPQMGYTENYSPTFLSTGNPCLDFFFHVVPDTPPESLTQRLQLAWTHNSLTTLKLIYNLRGVRGTGKSDKEGFYTAAFWLHRHHPKTLACNIGSLADFGYIKDMPEILFRLLEGSDVRKQQKAEWNQRKFGKTRGGGVRLRRGSSERFMANKKSKRNKSRVAKEIRVLNQMEREQIEKQKSSEARKSNYVAMAKKLLENYKRDPHFKFLYDRVSEFFAEALKADLEFLNAKEYRKISLAAKWCPSIDSSFDRSTLLCESIARRVFPRESFPEYLGIEEAHYAYRVRDRLRKQVLVPLRKALELPEVYIGANKWGAIPYNRVASVAMKFYKEKFLKHAEERFEKYLEDVKSGKSTIAAGALLPHEIIESLNDNDGGQVAELQWKRMVSDLLKMGKLKNCLAICDVSGSMYGLPMDVCVALGLLVSELSEEPWKGKVITFSKNPKLHVIQGDDLVSKMMFVKHMEWNMNTDFQKVFDLILEVAVNGNLKEDQMIKRVFVFSDMEFDQASTNNWETDYQVIQRKFRNKGYGSSVPEIVFWNLRDSRATPVPGTQNGVALVSGYSKNLMKLFLDNDGRTNPEAVMEAAISGEEYHKLVVLD
ncbi:DUF2828 domain-containing protein [Fagus crenata]